MDINDFLVKPDGNFLLANIDPASTPGIRSRKSAQEKLVSDIEELSKLQSMLYAQDQYALLVIFQAMDTAGKDSAIKHVLTGVNPQGVEVHNFRVPSAEELEHDFMWRAMKVLPGRGRIGIFNRSYYEDVLTVRVHPELLSNEKLPKSTQKKDIWKERFEDINAIEKYLTRNGVRIVKFHLAISKEEQRKRLLARIDEQDKNYKISTADVHERAFWKDYMSAYEEMLRYTSTAYAPWYVIPSDHKWYTRIAVADILVRTLQSLQLEFPKTTKEKLGEMERAERLLSKEE
jgi:PPK2 family polyphosphate:nucleotide phosphotransferase